MKDTLSRYLKKIGVLKFEDLNVEEKETYRNWEVALSGRNITEQDYKQFLEMELDQAVTRLTEIDLSREAETFRKVEVKFIKKVLTFLDMPQVEKKMLEGQIESL